MKRFKLIQWIIVWIPLLFVYACDEDVEVGRASCLLVTVEDEAGNDIVAQWNKLYTDKDFSKIEYIVTERSINHSLNETFVTNPYLHVYYHRLSKNEKMEYLFSQEFQSYHTGDYTSWQFKVFKSDIEDIFIEGIFVEYKGRLEFQWLYEGNNIPIGKNGHSSITLVRHDDGTYTLKE